MSIFLNFIYDAFKKYSNYYNYSYLLNYSIKLKYCYFNKLKKLLTLLNLYVMLI